MTVQKTDIKSRKGSPPKSIRISSIPILSFFTGAGFLDLGFHLTGFKKISWRNEYNPHFVRGFEHAMLSYSGNEHKITNTKSISDITPEEIIREAFKGAKLPDLFGFIGGTPCPDFATGGKHKGGEGKHGILSQIYVDRIISIKPTFFLLENVAGLRRTGKHKIFLDNLIGQLQTDYSLSHKVLNALDYGAPQFRERLFVIGFRKDWLKSRFDTEIDNGDESWFPWKKAPYPNAKSSYNWGQLNAFGETPDKPVGVPDNLMVGNHICDQEQIKALANGKDIFTPRSSKFNEINEGDSSGKSFKRLHRWRYSPAAAYGNNEVHLHPSEPRRLSVREVLRIQTVPDNYELPNNLTLSHKFKMVGNGVPVVLAEAVASSIADLIKNGPLLKDPNYQTELFNIT